MYSTWPLIHHVAEDGLELSILLPLPPKHWECNHAQPHTLVKWVHPTAEPHGLGTELSGVSPAERMQASRSHPSTVRKLIKQKPVHPDQRARSGFICHRCQQRSECSRLPAIAALAVEQGPTTEEHQDGALGSPLHPPLSTRRTPPLYSILSHRPGRWKSRDHQEAPMQLFTH